MNKFTVFTILLLSFSCIHCVRATTMGAKKSSPVAVSENKPAETVDANEKAAKKRQRMTVYDPATQFETDSDDENIFGCAPVSGQRVAELLAQSFMRFLVGVVRAAR